MTMVIGPLYTALSAVLLWIAYLSSNGKLSRNGFVYTAPEDGMYDIELTRTRSPRATASPLRHNDPMTPARPPVQHWVRRLALAHAGTRAALGAVMLVAPSWSARPWLGDAVDAGGGRVAFDAFAIRDLVLGAGMLRDLQRGGPVRHWFRLGLALELVDAGATLRHRRDLPAGPIPDAIVLLGIGGLVGGAVVAVLLDE